MLASIQRQYFPDRGQYDAVITNTGRMHCAFLRNAQESFKENNQVAAHRDALPLILRPYISLSCKTITYQLLAKLSKDYNGAKTCLEAAKSICEKMQVVERQDFQDKHAAASKSSKAKALVADQSKLIRKEIDECLKTTIEMSTTLEAWRVGPGSDKSHGPWGGTIERAHSPDSPAAADEGLIQRETIELFMTTVGAEDFHLFAMDESDMEFNDYEEDEEDDGEDEIFWEDHPSFSVPLGAAGL